MSDLSIYELEDIIWDDFDRSGDHIVPHPNNNHGSKDKCEEDSCKKPRLEVTPLQSNTSNLYSSGDVCQVNEESDPKTTLNENKDMMEQDSWSHRPDNVFSASGDADTAKNMAGLQSGGDAGISNLCFKSSNITSESELCTDDGILKDTSAAVDSNSYDYPQSHIHQSGDLNLFSNDGDDKASSDLLYYGWPDIGNFEDVDRMLSNCDSSFGLGGNDDELAWFTSEDPAGGYEEALKMELKFPCSDSSALTNICQDNGPRESENRSSIVSESEDEFKLKDQKKPLKQQNQTEGKKPGNRQQIKSLEHDSFGYPGHDHVPMQTASTQVTMAGIKSENRSLASPFQKETSNATNQVHSLESSGDPLFQGAASEISEGRKVHEAHACQPSLSGNQKETSTMLQASGNDLFSSQKQFHILEKETERQSDMEGVKKGGSAELAATIDVAEGSSISSEVDQISLEATSFLQLQQVMEQLDLRTKLCIRDSLYRLARSAEQRHNHAGIRDRTTTNCGATTDVPLMNEGTDKCTDFMDIETDTNPIDRTIAHLLFHRPSDKSNKPTPLPLKPSAKVHGSPMVAEKVSCEEGANESDDKTSKSGKD